MDNRKYSVNADVFEKKIQKFLKVSEERQRDANKYNKDWCKKHGKPPAPRKEST